MRNLLSALIWLLILCGTIWHSEVTVVGHFMFKGVTESAGIPWEFDNYADFLENGPMLELVKYFTHNIQAIHASQYLAKLVAQPSKM